MSHISAGVEYGLHCLLYLTGPPTGGTEASVRELSELQGVSVEFVAKLFTKLRRAGLTEATEGRNGGFRLAKAPRLISVLDVVDAIDGNKVLFECRQIRARCAIFNGAPPLWAMDGVCSVHQVMLDAQEQMRKALASQTLADLSIRVGAKAPRTHANRVVEWIDARRDLG